MKLLIIMLFVFSGCAVNPRYGVYRKVICESNRYGDLECDDGNEYYKPINAKSVYDEPF